MNSHFVHSCRMHNVCFKPFTAYTIRVFFCTKVSVECVKRIVNSAKTWDYSRGLFCTNVVNCIQYTFIHTVAQKTKVGFGAASCYPGVSLHHSCYTALVRQCCLKVEFWWSLLVLSWAYASQLGVRGQRWGRPFQYFNHRHHRHWCPFEIVNASRSSRFIETIAMKSDNDE